MKKIILLIALSVTFLGYSQDNRPPQSAPRGLDAKFIQLDTLTTVQRDALVVPSNKSRFIYNASVDSLQYFNLASQTWKSIGGSGLQNIVEDTTPQLGGNLDVNGNKAISNDHFDVHIDYDNTGTTSQFRVFSGTGTNLFGIEENGVVSAPSLSIAEIDAKGNTALINKEYADANYGFDPSISQSITAPWTFESTVNINDVLTIDNGAYIDMSGGKVISVANGTNPTDAVNKSQLDASIPDLSDYARLSIANTFAEQQRFDNFLNYFGDPNGNHVRIYSGGGQYGTTIRQGTNLDNTWTAYMLGGVSFNDGDNTVYLKQPKTIVGGLYSAYLPNITADRTLAVSVNGNYADDSGNITVAAGGDFSEWANSTGTGGDLLVTIGDYDDSGNGTKIIIDDAGQYVQFTSSVSAPSAVFPLLSSPSIKMDNVDVIGGYGTLTYNNEAQEFLSWLMPKDSGTLALLSDIPSSSLTSKTVADAYTLILSDTDKLITYDSASDGTVNVDVEANVDFPIGTVIPFEAIGVGQLTVHFETGVTGADAQTYTGNRAFNIIKTASDTWRVINPPVDFQTEIDANTAKVSFETSTDTGTTIDLSTLTQDNFGAASSASTFTMVNIAVGGYAEVLINGATEPTVTGATKFPNTASHIASTNMILCVKDFNGTRKFWFVEF